MPPTCFIISPAFLFFSVTALPPAVEVVHQESIAQTGTPCQALFLLCHFLHSHVIFLHKVAYLGSGHHSHCMISIAAFQVRIASAPKMHNMFAPTCAIFPVLIPAGYVPTFKRTCISSWAHGFEHLDTIIYRELATIPTERG